MHAIAIIVMIAGILGLLQARAEDNAKARADEERWRREAEEIKRRDDAVRQAEEDKAKRRAADPVIERYWAGVERRSRIER